MKTIGLLATSVLVSFFANAQTTPSMPEYAIPPISPADLVVNNNQPSATYIGQNALGKIYAMPQDNMPCLVPNIGKENAMPVYFTPLMGSTMPNAIPKQPLLKSPFTGNNSLLFKKAPAAPSKNLMLDLIRKKNRKP